jgi:hypothetical protein
MGILVRNKAGLHLEGSTAEQENGNLHDYIPCAKILTHDGEPMFSHLSTCQDETTEQS